MVRPLATPANGPGFDSRSRSEINISGLHVRHGWFTGIELVLSHTTFISVHFDLIE